MLRFKLYQRGLGESKTTVLPATHLVLVHGGLVKACTIVTLGIQHALLHTDRCLK